MVRKPKAQSTLDYAMTFAVVVAALLAMQIYMKRGLEGRLRQSTDEIGGQLEIEKTELTPSTRKRTVKTVEETAGGETTTYMGEAGKGDAEKITVTGWSEKVDAW